ncbi:winged helix-turn-helix domain-containing protein [Bradyrhizobium sp. CCBAU 53421]|uniref:winged helix-turn-helix domain-containing protein n=1 Tax=Bradyrhizobium sp. CCBAU 53421 TaxID=1325120 RepID=UPI00188AAD24|nr:winged helix-turn-helix domain-containing protein [Bradyrhizobium sp. CCBAU 53421]
MSVTLNSLAGMQDELSGRLRPIILYYGTDRDYVCLLRYILETAGFGLRVVIFDEECKRALEEALPDIILIDCSQVDFTQGTLREFNLLCSFERPIVILISDAIQQDHGNLTLQQEGFEVLPRATPPERLIGILHSILARPSARKLLIFEDIELDPIGFRVCRAKQELRLAPTEFRLLRYLMSEPSRVFTRDQLVRATWLKNVFVGSRTVDVHVARLRRALNGMPRRKLIRTVRGVGYALT